MRLRRIALCLSGFLVTGFVGHAYAQTPASKASPSESTTASDTPAWMTALGQRHQELVERNGTGTNAVLRDRLMGMLAVDQQVRNELVKQAQSTGKPPDVAQLHPVDAKLTTELKEIVAQSGWPTIQMVGFDASNAAMLILIHTEDHAWQRGLLPSLEQLAAADKIDNSQLATLVDKELVAAGKKQRYGTQFKVQDGHMAIYALEDPAGLDARRAAAMLPPLDVYKQMLASAYGMAVSNDVVAVPNEQDHP